MSTRTPHAHVLIDARKIQDYGIGTYLRALVPELCRLRPRWRFTLAIPLGLELPEETRIGNLHTVPEGAAKYSLAELWKLSRVAARQRADLFHAPHYTFPVRLPCPGVVTIHDCIHLRYREALPRPLGVLPRRISWLYARTAMGFAVAAARRVIAVSEATRSDLIRLLGAPGDKISVIPNGCEPVFFAGDDAAHSGRELPGLPGLPRRYVLFVGNPKPHKNLPLLRQVVRRLGNRHPGLRLVVVGAPPPRQPDPSEPVLWLGHLPRRDLAAVYRGATVFCMPSRFEGFGLPALEAMASGTPVVASRAGALPEVVADAGVLVPADSPTGLEAALDHVLSDQQLRQRLAQAGRHRARMFSWTLAAERTLQQYEAALGGEPR